MRRALTFVLLATVAAPYGAAAQQVSPSLRFRIGAWPDAVVLGSSVTAALVPVVWSGSFAHATCAPCDPARLWGIDRGTVGSLRPAAAAFSNGTLAAEGVLGAVFLARSRRGEGSGAFFGDATVIAEAVTIAQAATSWAKVLFHRPRPYLYVPGSSPPTADDGRSMPSGHTSTAFAAAAAYASILHRRGLLRSHAAEVTVLFGAATATGILRVVSHEHFPTDVVAGAALGFAVGWVIPAIHATLP